MEIIKLFAYRQPSPKHTMLLKCTCYHDQIASKTLVCFSGLCVFSLANMFKALGLFFTLRLFLLWGALLYIDLIKWNLNNEKWKHAGNWIQEGVKAIRSKHSL